MMQMITEGSMCCTHFIGRNTVNVLERNICILMLGLDNTGKTCTAKSLVGESLDTVAPTVGFSKESTKYKGFRVNIFDLGGSKSFRGIWPKYYHEVHGFIFVVDATSSDERMVETSNVFRDVLSHQKVRGKPVLMLCNKADMDYHLDEMYIVDTLKVERLVNEAKCPTRVELSIANKNQGLREGFKWLVKSIIAHLPELGPRVELDVEEERLKEEIRRAEVRKRMEEKRRRQNDEIQEEEEEGIPGFVPIEQYNAISRKTPKPPIQPSIIQNEETDDEGEITDMSTSPNPTIRICSSGNENQISTSPPLNPTPSKLSTTNASPADPSPPPQPGAIGPPPQPGPLGPPPQPAPAGGLEFIIPSPKSSCAIQANGAITVLPNASLVPSNAPSSPTPALENITINDYSPRTPLPPIGNTAPSPFLQMPINAEILPGSVINDGENTSINQPQKEDIAPPVIGRESTNSDEEINTNGILNPEGNSESSSVFESKRNSLTGSVTSLGGHILRNNSASSCGTRKLELEPISRAKTKSVLKKVINNNYKANAYTKSKSSSSESNPSSNAGSRSSSAYKQRRSSIIFKPIVNW